MIFHRDSGVMVAGARGMVGSAIVRRLEKCGYENLLTPSHGELELTDLAAVARYFETHRPEVVFLAAARVGGILANSTYPGEFIYQNLMIQTHVIHQAWRHKTRRLIFLGSSCIYPKLSPQPITEECLLTGPLEPTNSPYAVAKIAGIEMCWAYNRQYDTCFIPVMPTNLYGPNDNYDPKTSHVLPALIRKFHEAKENGLPQVEVWGTGTPRREFLHVDDLADACLMMMNRSFSRQTLASRPLFNVGTGTDMKISELARIVREVVGYQGKIVYDRTKPDGTPVKRLDVALMEGLGWRPKISLRQGILATYDAYRASLETVETPG